MARTSFIIIAAEAVGQGEVLVGEPFADILPGKRKVLAIGKDGPVCSSARLRLYRLLVERSEEAVGTAVVTQHESAVSLNQQCGVGRFVATGSGEREQHDGGCEQSR